MEVSKGLYSNVDVTEHGVEEPQARGQRSQPDTEGASEEESVYEPIDPATGFEGKETQPVTSRWFPAWKPSCRYSTVTLAGAFLLAISVFLNILLLALGAVHYSTMTATLDQMKAKNKQLQEAVSSTFLLFNENRKVCVTMKQHSYLTEAPCDPRVQKQHFQWFSGGLLRHVDSQLCVAVSKAVSKTMVLLQPCDVRSPLQRWECRDHDLLALEGEDLYFNYGNNLKKVVMLYDRNGPWSRWMIYGGTHNNTCTQCTPFAREWASFQESYYYYSHTPGTWDVANQSCTSMKSHLVMINSAEEKAYVATITKTSSSWIGLTDQVMDGSWKWVDGTQMSNSYWHQNEPNGGKAEGCVLMEKDLWYDYPCRDSYHWICERKL